MSHQDASDRVKRAAQPTRLDIAIQRLSPRWAASRIKSRVDHELRMMMATRAAENFAAYEAAANDRLRGENWIAPKTTSNDQLQDELERLVDRANDLYRNDVFAASAVNGRVDNVIGTGIRPQCRV